MILRAGRWVIALLCLSTGYFTAEGAEGATGVGMPTSVLHRADSMFHLKQYTESMDLYTSLFHNKFYSPSMLLKMAFIEEGLNHLGQSLYYLNLYFVATRDPQALAKIDEVASRNKLEGYTNSDATRFVTFLNDHHLSIISVLGSISIFLLAAIYYQKFKLRIKPIRTAIVLAIFLIALFVQGLLHVNTQAIVASPSTYLMTGPSAGASVIAIVGEGHRLEILGKTDVWVKVKWLNEEGYVREDALLQIK